MESIKLFIPGRVGLIGELSDLVSPYLDSNKKLIPGKCLASRIDKGIYSTIKKSDKVIYNYDDLHFECELDENILLKEIKDKPFYSYLCGTILYMYRKYNIGGNDINIDKMDLPIKNGLSSSASFCITIVKGLNELYNLNMNNQDIIDASHNGEILAGSRCGNLDYSSIMNEGLCLFTFYKDSVGVDKVTLKKKIYFLIVNLNSSKNTKLIMKVFNETLSDMNSKNKSILEIVGKKNKQLVEECSNYLNVGNIKMFGKCLNEAQVLMDNAINECSEFKAINLHMIMNDSVVRDYSYGIKSIGSGGDGSALIVCKNKNKRNILYKYLNDKYGMTSIKFDLQ